MLRPLPILCLFAVVLFASCAAEESALNSTRGNFCQTWEVQACACADGSQGIAPCLADGSGFGDCGACQETPWSGAEVNLGGEMEGGSGTPDQNPSTTPSPVDPSGQDPVDPGTDPNQSGGMESGDQGGGTDEMPEDQGYVPDEVNWVEDVKPITDAKCVGCHSETLQLGDIGLATYEDTQMMSPNCGEGTVGETILLKVVEPVTCGQIMPPAGYPGLSDAEVKVIEDWVLLGMPYGPEDLADSGDSGNTETGDTTDGAEDEGEMAGGPEEGDSGSPGDTTNEGTEGADAEGGAEDEDSEDLAETEVEEPEEVVAFEDVHPILQKSCSGLACHQYSGFAQSDVEKAYNVVVEKDFANNIVDAILDGRMPANAFGFPLCSGDPSVDTNPKCLTAEEQDLVLAWYDNYEGTKSDGQPIGGFDGPLSYPDVQATFSDVHPILESGCSGFFCHSGGLANDDIEKAYNSVINKGLCDDILDQVQTGGMPQGLGCSGDPVVDAGIPGCLNQEEHDILISWITGDEPCPQ